MANENNTTVIKHGEAVTVTPIEGGHIIALDTTKHNMTVISVLGSHHVDVIRNALATIYLQAFLGELVASEVISRDGTVQKCFGVFSKEGHFVPLARVLGVEDCLMYSVPKFAVDASSGKIKKDEEPKLIPFSEVVEYMSREASKEASTNGQGANGSSTSNYEASNDSDIEAAPPKSPPNLKVVN